MPASLDGPLSPLFQAVPFKGNVSLANLPKNSVSPVMRQHAPSAPTGDCVAWGMPFNARRVLLARNKPATISLGPLQAGHVVFMHTTDAKDMDWTPDGFVRSSKGVGLLGEVAGTYTFLYEDGVEIAHTLRRRHEIGMFQRPWGENCFEAVAHQKPIPLRPLSEQHEQVFPWGASQTRTQYKDILPWVNWIWAWENPRPAVPIVALRVEAEGVPLLLSGISAGSPGSSPYRWRTRRKAVLRLPKERPFDPALDARQGYRQVQLDLGQVISAQPRALYPNKTWGNTPNNEAPRLSDREVLIEYASHAEARFHLEDGSQVPVKRLENLGKTNGLAAVAPATQRVELRVYDKETKQTVPVKLHVHGEAGEYLAPENRHRIPNAAWFEDYSVDFLNQDIHYCTYINGEAVLHLPEGKVYIEVSKGFEISPQRKVVEIGRRTKKISIPLRRVLPWRARGWASADTHVHFLSPHTALLEGAAEDVNVINLLASQWGELMTNVGDFDGKTTLGAVESGGDGEYLVRVGTENRQHVLGHISLLGYTGRMITPLCTGGPDESAIGDAVTVLMSEWARQCKAQGGLVIMPHFPNPRCENAACIIEGAIDAVEMCSWGDLYGGIDPYSLSDWYRYLNCGYFVPAVGGTDKMSANTPVGAIRTYARTPKDTVFTYESWMDAIRSGQTFVSYGPLLDLKVEGQPPGSRIQLKRSGGALCVEWEAASVTTPITRVELIVNGVIREAASTKPEGDSGYWTIEMKESGWMALLVRGKYRGHPEIIAAHSSPVVVEVAGSPFLAGADALTILEQIEGALAYLDTLAVQTTEKASKRMCMILKTAHRKLHHRLHRHGVYHHHTTGLEHEHSHHDH